MKNITKTERMCCTSTGAPGELNRFAEYTYHFATSELPRSNQWNDSFFNEQWNWVHPLGPLVMSLAGIG